MRRAKPTIAELAFFATGAMILVLGWLADLLGIFELGASGGGGHGASATLPLRLFFTLYGVAFATAGMAYENFPQILSDGEMAKRWIVAFLFLADGGLHLYALNDHLGEVFSSSFFALFASLQLAAAFVIPYTGRELDFAWLGITGFLIAAYVVTRTMAVWPIGFVEDVEPLGVASKLIEALTVVVLLSLWQTDRAARRTTARAATPTR